MHDIFCFTDIHGMYDLYKAIMNYCIEQDSECCILYLGDACDRGPNGYSIMKELLNTPRVIYLKGNHEDMFTKAAREINEHFDFQNMDRERVRVILNSCLSFDYRYAAIQDSLTNGGMPTLLDWIEDGAPVEIIERIERLPLTFSTDMCDFCHAAGIPKTFARIADAEYEGREPNSYDVSFILWSRSTLKYGWTPNRTCIFGHTPVPYLLEELKVKCTEENIVRPYKYYGEGSGLTGAKINMDTGAVFTGYAWVLNCLTMRAQGFMIENERVKKIEMIQV